MIKSFLLSCLVCLALFTDAKTILVKNIDELRKASKEAKPGDIIMLQDGVWNNVSIELGCHGTPENPITFKAQTAGKVIISGESKLELGGSFITVDGLYFTNGFAGDNPVISFRINKNKLANNCRVTNTVINDFNNAKRMDENYWVSFSGKNNRLDHCSFLNKKNMGVLLAVLLDDERSRENFHSIDHNYFGVRLPLASNSGEMIRVGVSQHCEFNSNTQITDNFFEHCDGETEIISIKSGSNVVRNNLFKECQGSVVLRHGNYNTVEGNVFLGNDKDGTGGVRVINKGQWVVDNFFYKCRGVGFRAPLSLMNGVFNSPANRYVAVTDAVIANNSFYNCTPISLCEGSDTERTVVPRQVYFADNIFYNDRDAKIYNAFDDISGITFIGNKVSPGRKIELTPGFYGSRTRMEIVDNITIPLPYASKTSHAIPDSLVRQSKSRLTGGITAASGFSGKELYLKIKQNAYNNCGANWYGRLKAKAIGKTKVVHCNTGKELQEALSKNYDAPLKIMLGGVDPYIIDGPLDISGTITIASNKPKLRFVNRSGDTYPYFIQVLGGSNLSLVNINFDLTGLLAKDLISADLHGSSNHSNLSISGCSINNFSGTLFNAVKSTVFDSIIIKNSSFTLNKGTLFNFSNETDKKGYYNVEKLSIRNNRFTNNEGQLLTMLRGGNDESTLGPWLIFADNKVENCNTANELPLVHLFGTQRSALEQNVFTKSNAGKTILKYEDLVRAAHIFRNNTISNSGKVDTNKFVDTPAK